MADQAPDKVDATAPAVETSAASADSVAPEQGETAPKVEAETKEGGNGQDEKPAEEAKTDETASKPDDATASVDTAKVEEKPADADTEMKEVAPAAEAQEASVIDTAADTNFDATADTTATETPSAKNKNRRKSAAGETKGKTLSKKASKAKITHTNAKPGDQFLVKLKGFPAWPAIVCDEDMLPEALLNTRPVTAAKKDGTYNENYAEGGKRVNDRTFPVMYLCTWEFGWVNNKDFTELTPEKAKDSVSDKMRKDLKSAYELAAEGNDVDHYKDMLRGFQEELIKRQEAEAAAAATPKKSSKKAKSADDGDVDMADIGESAKTKSKKRKADEETSTPQRSDSVKKPKIKLNTSSTPKTADGTSAAKKDESAAKPAKPKKQKSKDNADKDKSQEKDAKMTPEERHARKEKEVMYLRHKLQRGLLTRDQQPQESEMQQMSEYVSILEKLKDLEVSIIRATKINKVLKAILKLETIPKEEEFKFKPRSQALLEKWNKLIDGDSGATNGVNGSAETEKKPESNGSKPAAAAEPEKTQPAAEPETPKVEEETAKDETTTATAETVEATA